MKKLNLFILIFLLIGGFVFGQIPSDSVYFKTVLATTDTPITVTTNWQNVGSPVYCVSSDGILWWPKITDNDSTTWQFQVLAQVDSSGTIKHQIGIFDIQPTLITLNAWVIQLSAAVRAASTIPPFETRTNRKIYYYQLQVKVGTVGATAGTVDYVYATK
jgi:hypothetical protein